MALSTIRRITDEDKARIEAAAKRFCDARSIHSPHFTTETWQDAVESYLYAFDVPADDLYSWQKAFCRALRQPYDRNLTTGYGYVGVEVK